MKKLHTKWVGMGMAATLALGALGAARAVDIGDAIKVFGIGWAVRQFGGQINGFLNTTLAQRNARIAESTKVVPIISLGNGGHIGAAQVMGPQAQLRRVQAVGQGELTVGGQEFRLKGLFPIDTLNPTKGVSRVQGVGVSAIIDFKI
ncbi:MAG: hypothetical protein KY468_13655 [Armatimonadetes bacterium]|nr:hypothetical protein [Armatimonadota bacterium]